MIRLIIAGLAVALLAGCATTQGPSNTVPIVLPDLPASLSAPCAPPVTLPTAATGQQDVQRYWATDRTNLRKCANAKAGLVAGYDNLKRQLAK